MSEQNATETGDYLWTNKIVGEMFPTALTPSTWSVWQDYFSKLSFGDTPSIDSIGGRPYLNYSAMYSFLKKITRSDERVRRMIRDSVGLPPEGVDIPPFPISWKIILLEILPREIKNELRKRKLKKNTAQFLEMVRERCQQFECRIGQLQRDELMALWRDGIWPLWNEIHFLMDKQNEELNLLLSKSKTTLTSLLGHEEADMVLATISSAGEIASVGPLVGLSRLSKGELSRQEYLWRYGHRGPNENELLEPRQHEDSHWLDKQLEEYMRAPIDVDQLLAKRDAESVAVLREVKLRLPSDKATEVEGQIRQIERTNSNREATRSELTRLVSVIRTWFLRAGELAELGDRVFFLTVDEVIEILSGDAAAVARIFPRKQAYETYRALPSLPMWIRGSFDPIEWAADPRRRKDVSDPGAPLPAAVATADTLIKGYPGSAGRVEGLVRHIVSPDQGDQLQPGEILITRATDVGWTLLFPRAAAVITDIGGSLSHAAIVARELGIPAVVGCGNATTRLQTGVRVRVDGGRGTVEILRRGEDV